MLGGPKSFASGGWQGGLMEQLLPVLIAPGAEDWDPGAEVQARIELASVSHPIWQIVSDARQNREIVRSFPSFEGANHGLRAKTALATPLAVANLTPNQPPPRAVAVRQPASPGPTVARTQSPPDVGPPDVAESADPAKTGPVLVVGPYGKGRTLAMSTAITSPWANAFLNEWGEGDNRYYAKFWRNVVYWVSGNSVIGRRRLIAECDNRYYNPGETVALRAVAYDEGANLTQEYRVVAIIDPLAYDDESIHSPVRWPNGISRAEEMEGPLMQWGEPFELPRLHAGMAGPLGEGEDGYGLNLRLNDVLSADAASEGLRVELTAYEGSTQVDSTSLKIQILNDPFEKQNPFPDHELLQRLADLSGGQVIDSADELADVTWGQPVNSGPPIVRKSPLWSNWWVFLALIGALSVEWFWRRSVGLA